MSCHVDEDVGCHCCWRYATVTEAYSSIRTGSSEAETLVSSPGSMIVAASDTVSLNAGAWDRD
jgi:hypothetical protein